MQDARSAGTSRRRACPGAGGTRGPARTARPTEFRNSWCGLELLDIDAVDRYIFDRPVAHAGADAFDGVDDLAGFLVSHFTEDAVLALQPVGGDGGDEELGT